MEVFDRIAKKFKNLSPAEKQARKAEPLPEGEIVLASSSHIAEEVFYGDGEYRTTFRVNDAFKPAKSHAGEVDMLHTYFPGVGLRRLPSTGRRGRILVWRF